MDYENTNKRKQIEQKKLKMVEKKHQISATTKKKEKKKKQRLFCYDQRK